MFRKQSLKLRMQLLIGAVAVLAFAATVGYAIVSARSLEREGALARSAGLAARYSAELSNSLNAVVGIARESAKVVGTLADAGVALDAEPLTRDLATQLAESGVAEADALWVLLTKPLPGGTSAVAVHRDTAGVREGLGAGAMALAQDPWVASQLAAKMEAIAEPRQVDKVAFTRIVVPIVSGGEQIGVVGVDVDMRHYVTRLQEIGEELATFGTGYMSIVSNEGRYAAHPKHAERIGNSVVDTDPWSQPFLQQIRSGDEWETESLSKTLGLFSLRVCRPIVIGRTGTPWAVWMTLPMDEFIMKKANAMTQRSLLMTAGGLLLLGFVVSIVARGLVSPLRRVAQGLDNGSTNVREMAEQLKQTSDDLADGASEQASDIEETSASLEELSAMTARNAENAQRADEYMAQTKEVVAAGNQVVERLIASMREISASSAETKKIVKTIDEIAFQTNILALNAAVEAARAGGAGAGFAVVADEVRNLAQRAAEASRNTSSLIDNSISSISEGEHLVTRTYEHFTEIAGSAAKAAELVAEIRDASHQGDKGISQINSAVSQVDQLTQRNAENASVAASAASNMFNQSEAIKSHVAALLELIEGEGKAAAGNRQPIEPTGGNGLEGPAPVADNARRLLKPFKGTGAEPRRHTLLTR